MSTPEREISYVRRTSSVRQRRKLSGNLTLDQTSSLVGSSPGRVTSNLMSPFGTVGGPTPPSPKSSLISVSANIERWQEKRNNLTGAKFEKSKKQIKCDELKFTNFIYFYLPSFSPELSICLEVDKPF